MVVINREVRIERPPEAVFDAVIDPRSELEWNPDVRVMEKLSEGEIRPGSRFRAKWTKSPVVELEILRYGLPRWSPGWAGYRCGVDGQPMHLGIQASNDVVNLWVEGEFGACATPPRSGIEA